MRSARVLVAAVAVGALGVVLAAVPASAASYTVARGDTLIGIAQRSGVPVSTLQKANPRLRDPNRLRIGQVLEVPAATAVATSAGTSAGGPPARPTRPIPYPPPKPGGVYVVQPGDNLSKIARRTQTTVARLAGDNAVTNPNLLAVGTVLRITANRYSNLPERLRIMPDRIVLMEYFDDAAVQAGVDPSLLKALCWTESGWRPGAESGVGAIGLCQLMPSTAVDMAVELGVTGADPWDPLTNMALGARYLRQQLDRFGGDATLALAAYYQGHVAVRRGGISDKGRAYGQTVLAVQPMFQPDPA